MVPEYMTQAPYGGDTFVVRAEPTGMPQGLGMASSTVVALASIRRWIRRDRRWLLRRRRSDDPVGPVLYEELLESEAAAKQRVTEIAEELRRGSPPWSE